MQGSYDVLVVGAGHAGAQVAICLRQMGFAGSIAIAGDEPHPPYERPPLSKDYLAGEKAFDRILIRPEAFWAERGVELLPSCRVASVDAGARSVALARGGTIGFGSLVWATGGTPRLLSCPGAQGSGIHAVRRRADVDAIMGELGGVETVLVVGGGYIGLEAAAVLRKLGKAVTLVEALPRVLSRVAGPALSAFFEEEHRAHGVDLRTGTALAALRLDAGGRVAGAELADGSTVDAQMAIVGIGIVPEVGPLLAAGAVGGNGVDVDAHCRTSLPGIYAIGDCAAHANRFAGGLHIRLESVQNANDMAKVAAQAITGNPADYDAVPWFWSNQYDLRLQTVGLAQGHDEEIVRGDPAGRSFSVIYRKAGRVIALDCVNATKDYVAGRKLVLEGELLDPAGLADPALKLTEVGRV